MVSSRSASNERPLNRLLARLTPDQFKQLRPHLKTVSLDPKKVLHKHAETLRCVYFPPGGIVSMVTQLPI